MFLLGVLWVVESIRAGTDEDFELKVTTGDPAALRSDVEAILRRYHINYELRTAGTKDLVYETELPIHTRTDRVSNAILLLGYERRDRSGLGREEEEEEVTSPIGYPR